jgi:hypothetical protein
LFDLVDDSTESRGELGYFSRFGSGSGTVLGQTPWADDIISHGDGVNWMRKQDDQERKRSGKGKKGTPQGSGLAGANKRIDLQTRKVLGKHYANKYRIGRS